MKSKLFMLIAFTLILSASALAQNKVTMTLADSNSGEPVSFATVTLTKPGAKTPAYASLSDDKGNATVVNVRKGSYRLKVELLGYKAYTKDIEVAAALSLGTLKIDPDRQSINAATVSAVGNPIVVRKDTIEYNASSFKTTENDVLEDLLKKLPGVEVSEDGSITVNGETIKKITIDGKTFFLDDPQLASKNIPAKIVNKLKVINKKSDQAEFTGIDDGEEEQVIDLSIKPGMMKGLFGTAMVGGGHDIPSEGRNTMNDYRYQGAGFMGRFTDKSQLSVVLNANNTNNRGFNDLSGAMMQGMRGGGGGMGRGQGGWGGGNGVTNSYLAGINGGGNLFDDKMELTGNYLFNHSDRKVEENSSKTTYMTGENYISKSQGLNDTHSNGHRFGIRLKHTFSENTSIIFEPRINFGNGWYNQNSYDETYYDNLAGKVYKMNDATTTNSGQNNNVSTGGFILLRQRLGAPGRTLTVMGNLNYSNNVLDGLNVNTTNNYDETGATIGKTGVNQSFNNKSNNVSMMGRLTYTEPLGGNFYLEANYSYNWNKQTSVKETIDVDTGKKDDTYSNNILNDSRRQNIGLNVMYQISTLRAQLGFSAIPTKTHNETTKGLTSRPYDDFRWNFAPTAMLWWEMSENANGRIFYRGNSSQPSTSQLMPVPDNTDPLNISFGNPALTPYFSHSLRGDVRYNNKQNFTSFNVRFNGGYVQNPIVNATWFDSGTSYSMPFNGPASMNAGLNAFVNAPIAKSGFSISNMLAFNWSQRSSYVGTDIDMTTYREKGFYDFMDEFVGKFNDPSYFDEHIALNTVNTYTVTERLRLTFRTDNLELVASGRTRMNSSIYNIAANKDNTCTWNNQVRGSVNWTWSAPGLTVKTDFSYNWYNGYANPQEATYVWDAEIQKMLFKEKATLALKCYDILGQGKNLSVTENANYHMEAVNNTLGRYLILSFTYRFGNFNNARNAMRGHGPGPR